ncbi:MAG: hypothetical protein ABI550_07465 [Ignavibacteriaceae bacterium]
MKWFFINSGFQNGNYNMDLDIQLAKNCLKNEIYFRLYRWNPYCISLGANQSFEEVKIDKIKKDNIDIVKRPTGGRAVLHAEELTYSFVMPVLNYSSPKKIYHEINMAIYNSLKLYDEKLSNVELEKVQPDLSLLYKNQNNSMCFAASVKSEINYYGKKLVGSAQRKFNNSILQHGSILCGDYHKKIADYFNFDEEKLNEINLELEKNTTDLKSILNQEIDYEKLSSCLYFGFENYFKISFNEISVEDFSFIAS